jgi:hypothetical protein
MRLCNLPTINAANSVEDKKPSLQPSLEKLPPELVLKIFYYLSPPDLCSLGKVSRHISILSSDNSLWNKYYKFSPQDSEISPPPQKTKKKVLDSLNKLFLEFKSTYSSFDKVDLILKSPFLSSSNTIKSVMKEFANLQPFPSSDGSLLGVIKVFSRNEWLDDEITRKIIKANPQEWRSISRESSLWDDEEFVLAAISNDSLALEYASERLKDSDKVVLTAITEYGRALSHASERLRDNDAIVLAAVSSVGSALGFASIRLRDNDQIVLTAISKYAPALEHASDRLKDSEATILNAVLNAGWTLMYASDRLKNNHAIVLAAVSNYAFALQVASEEMRNNREIVLAAVRQNPDALQYASLALQADPEILNAWMMRNIELSDARIRSTM